MINLLIPLLFVVILAVIYAAMIKDSMSRLTIILVGLLFVLTMCFYTMRSTTKPPTLGEYLHKIMQNPFKKEGFTDRTHVMEGFTGAPVDYALGRCGGFSYGKLADITPKNGTYDGLIIKKGSGKPDYPILSQDKVAYHSPVGDAYALNPDAAASKYYPTIDGTPNSPHHMFMFAYNRSSPDCCPSTFSSDRGCVCMSEAQRNFINRRGNQKSYNGNPDF
jgi:hypothetical protein